MLDFPMARRTDQYRIVGLPQAPVFHPYDLIGDHNLREGKMAPQFSFNLQLPADFFEVLPPSVAARIAALGIPREQVDIFWVVQDQPWTGEPLLFRPHYWTDPQAPSQGVYHQNRKVHAGLFEAPPGIHFRGHRPEDFVAADLSVHGPEHGAGTILASPPGVLVMEGLDHRRSASFWTLTQSGHRAAATLHALLNDADQAALEALSPQVTTLRTLLRELEAEGSPLRGTPMVDKFRQLLRPSLWSSAPEKELVVPERGEAGAYQVLRCGPGEVVTGTCQVATEGMTRGRALLGVRFDSDTQEGLGWGAALGAMHTPEGGATSPVALGVRGTAPAGTTKALVYVQANHANPGAQARFSAIAFTSTAPAGGLWPGSPAPVVALANGGTGGKYHFLPCAPGEVFTGACQVQTQGLVQGQALIGLRFDSETQVALSYGAALGRDRTPEGGSASMPLAVQGRAPAGATKVLMYVQVQRGEPGAEARFEGVAFGRMAVASEPPAPERNNLWPSAPQATLQAPAGGTAGKYHVVPCVAGDLFTASCQVETEGMTQGLAQIGLRFDSDAAQGLGAGTPVGPSRTPEGGSATPIRLGLEGVVPIGATKALLYLQLVNANPGASARFGSVAFQKAPPSGTPSGSAHASAPSPQAPEAPPLSPLYASSPTPSPSSASGVMPLSPSPPSGPAVQILKFKAGKPVVAQGDGVDLHWDLSGMPTRLSLAEAVTGASSTLLPSATMQHIERVVRRQTFKLEAEGTDPSTGRAVVTSAEASVGAQGVALLAGDAQHLQGAYANGHLGHGAAWRHLAGLLWVKGDLFLAEGQDHTIRKLSLQDGALAPFAGVRGGPQETPQDGSGRLNLPGPMAHLAPFIYVADTGSHTIKRIREDGRGGATVFAGIPGKAGLKDGPGLQALFNSPADLVADPVQEILYVADRDNGLIRQIDRSGMVSTMALSVEKREGTFGEKHSLTETTIPGIQGLALGSGGALYVASPLLPMIQKVVYKRTTTRGWWNLTSVAGVAGAPGYQDGPADLAQFREAKGLILQGDELLVADAGNNAIRRIRLNTGEVDTLAGLPLQPAGFEDGDRSEARFDAPSRLVAGDQGKLFVVDQRDRALRVLGPGHQVATMGGPGLVSGEGAVGGPPAQARFRKPLGVAVNRAGVTFVADSGNHAIRRVTPAGVVDVFAGSLETPGDADGSVQNARFQDPSELAMDGQGVIYVLEPTLGRLRTITPAGDVATLPPGAGTPTLIAACPLGRGSTYAVARRTVAGDGEVRTNVYLVRDGAESLVESCVEPVALAMDAHEHVYILTDNRAKQLVSIRKFGRLAGTASTWAELAAFSVGPGGRVGKKFGLPRIHGVAADSKGRLYLTDSANGLVWKIYFDMMKGEVVAGRHPFLGPTGEVQHADAPLYLPHRIAVTPMDDLVLTSGHAVLQITAPSTPDDPWTAPRAPGLSRPGAGGAGRPNMQAMLSAGLQNHTLKKMVPPPPPQGLLGRRTQVQAEMAARARAHSGAKRSTTQSSSEGAHLSNEEEKKKKEDEDEWSD
jgi:hypothetical protein